LNSGLHSYKTGSLPLEPLLICEDFRYDSQMCVCVCVCVRKEKGRDSREFLTKTDVLTSVLTRYDRILVTVGCSNYFSKKIYYQFLRVYV
jgi:hypothetical protein